MRPWLALIALGAAPLGCRSNAGPAPESPPVFGDRLFESVFSRIRASSLDTLGDEELYRRAAQGVTSELDDPYAFLRLPRSPALPPSDEPMPQGLFLDRRDGLVVVIATVPGSPADSAGVLPGDILLAVDSVVMAASRLERAGALLDGLSGTDLTLRVRRTGGIGGSTASLTVRRERVRASRWVQADTMGGGVGWVRLFRFGRGIADSVGLAVARLQAQGARSLVLDLRGTVQGGADQAAGAAVADLFLDPGAALVASRMRQASGSPGLVDSTDSRFSGMPLAVLIDAGTAGAGEVVAGALQDHDRGVILGSPSFGRGVTQGNFSLGGGAVLTLTTALWMTPNGRQIQRPPQPAFGDTLPRPVVMSDRGRPLVGGGGIVPDRTIADTGSTDLVLAEARRLLELAKTPERVFALLDR